MRFLPTLLIPLLVSCESWRMETDARSKCEKGLAIIQRVVGMKRDALNDADRARTRAALTSGRDLIRDGLAIYAKAEVKTGKPCEVGQYIEGIKVARMLLMELKD